MANTRTEYPNDNFRGLRDVRSLADLQSWVDAIVNQIPEQYRAATIVNIHDGDDGWLSSMFVSYERPETLEDIANDEAARREAEATRNADEYAIFQRLKAKFEPNKF